jgi:hypothetical protein
MNEKGRKLKIKREKGGIRHKYLKEDKRKNKRNRGSRRKGVREKEIFAVFNRQKLASSIPYFGLSGRVGRSFLQVGMTHDTQARYTVLPNLGVTPDKQLTMSPFDDAVKRTAKAAYLTL